MVRITFLVSSTPLNLSFILLKYVETYQSPQKEAKFNIGGDKSLQSPPSIPSQYHTDMVVRASG